MGSFRWLLTRYYAAGEFHESGQRLAPRASVVTKNTRSTDEVNTYLPYLRYLLYLPRYNVR